MDKKELMNEYGNICFALKIKQEELENTKINLFVLNPEIQKLTKEISELTKQKQNLEDEMGWNMNTKTNSQS